LTIMRLPAAGDQVEQRDRLVTFKWLPHNPVAAKTALFLIERFIRFGVHQNLRDFASKF
jgi:hypothetical protein